MTKTFLDDLLELQNLNKRRSRVKLKKAPILRSYSKLAIKISHRKKWLCLFHKVKMFEIFENLAIVNIFGRVWQWLNESYRNSKISNFKLVFDLHHVLYILVKFQSDQMKHYESAKNGRNDAHGLNWNFVKYRPKNELSENGRVNFFYCLARTNCSIIAKLQYDFYNVSWL